MIRNQKFITGYDKVGVKYGYKTVFGPLLEASPSPFRSSHRQYERNGPCAKSTISDRPRMANKTTSALTKASINEVKESPKRRRQTYARWPASVAALAGAWPDFPTAEEIRSGHLPRPRR